MTISTEEYTQSAIRGDMVQLEKLLEICNVPQGEVKQIKDVFIRAVAKGSDYGYNLGRDDKLRDGERAEYLELLSKFDELKSRHNKVIKTRNNYYAQIQRLEAKVERLKKMKGMINK